ncbi:hypothetical protein JMG10_11130 [Nostoc ellipsosporum NOK]|nr:hypothetical protein [Nostoc ellipsosporum NOK]
MYKPLTGRLMASMLAFSLIVFSCRKKDNTPVNQDIYIGGYDAAAGGNSVPVIWKNGTPQVLPAAGARYAYVTDIYVDETGVYASGNKRLDASAPEIPVYWKNGIEYVLPIDPVIYPRPLRGFTTGIWAANGSVYVSGYEADFWTHSYGILWKDGVRSKITTGGSGELWDVAVSGSDVYLAGGDDGEPGSTVQKGAYWKNGFITRLSPTAYFSRALKLKVSGSNFYVLGLEKTTAGSVLETRFWKNGTAQNTSYLPASDTWQSVMAFDEFRGDVTFAGSQLNSGSISLATIWRNGQPINYTDGSLPARCLDVARANGAIYAVGYDSNGGTEKAALWKNGVRELLSANNSSANCIFVR